MVRKTPVTPPTTHDLHAASLRQLQGCHVPTTSASSWSSDHAVDACRWRAQQLLGPPVLRSLKRARSQAGLPGATVSVLDTGVSRSTCSWDLSLAHLQPRGESTTQATEKTLMRRRLMRRTMAKTAKDQKTSSRGPAGEEREHVHVSSTRWRAEQEDKGRKTAYCPCYPRQGGDQLSPCLPKAHSGCWPPP
jgi:hypothetical protein